MLGLTPEEWTAVALSLRVATVATLASLGPGLAVAWLLARRRFPGRALLDGLVHLRLQRALHDTSVRRGHARAATAREIRGAHAGVPRVRPT